VYTVTPTGAETVIYSFQGGSDGTDPYGPRVVMDHKLYGTTATGGSANAGTVFSITPQGKEQVLYSFTEGADGGYPYAPLIDVGGTLYGTTGGGGANNAGTVFSITPTGIEKIIYSFKNGRNGFVPNAGLLYVNGTFYGTTTLGGGSTTCQYGCGIAYSVTLSGAETVLHRFTGGTDGSHPNAPLINAGGKLYGTAAGGGANGNGVVFEIKP
jgi:uncharacterized repeat protein (TIGR03803 family)